MVLKGSKRTKKQWRKLDSSVYDEALRNYNSQVFSGGLVKDKSDMDLFFTNISKKSKVPTKVKPLQKPLRCLAALENKSSVDIGGSNNNEVKIPKSGKKRSTIITKVDTSDYNKIRPDPKYHDIWLLKEDPMETNDKISQTSFPHPGESYNPSASCHQSLLWSAHTAVAKDEEEKNRIAEIFNDSFTISADELQRREREMMMSGFGDSPLRPVLEEVDGMRNSCRREKKTRAQVNTKKRNIIRERRRARAAVTLRRDKQISNIAEINKQLDLEKAHVGEKRKRSGKRRVARIRFKEPLPLDVKLSDELPGSLRELEPEGSLLKDHYVDFQRRSLICPSRMLSRRKGKFREVFRRNLRFL